MINAGEKKGDRMTHTGDQEKGTTTILHNKEEDTTTIIHKDEENIRKDDATNQNLGDNGQMEKPGKEDPPGTPQDKETKGEVSSTATGTTGVNREDSGTGTKSERDNPNRTADIGRESGERGSSDNNRANGKEKDTENKENGSTVVEETTAEIDDSEWSQLRCGSQCTEELAQKQKQREERRSKREGSGKAGRPDYPGFAFGSAMFSSDATMKFNIIKNELHNIMKSQLKRVDGEVNAFANRIKEFDKKLEESEKYVRLATAALADAVALQIEESKNQSEEEEKESNLSAFDQHVLFLEAQLTEARFKAAQSIEILEDCNQAQANILERVDPKDIEQSRKIGNNLNTVTADVDEDVKQDLKTSDNVSESSARTSSADPTADLSAVVAGNSLADDNLNMNDIKVDNIDHIKDKSEKSGEVNYLSKDSEKVSSIARNSSSGAVNTSSTSTHASSSSQHDSTPSPKSSRKSSSSSNCSTNRFSSRGSPDSSRKRGSPASSDKSFTSSNLNDVRRSPEVSDSHKAYHNHHGGHGHGRERYSPSSSRHYQAGANNNNNKNSLTPPRNNNNGSTRYSPRDRVRGLIPPPSLHPANAAARGGNNNTPNGGSGGPSRHHGGGKGLRKLRSPKASSLMMHGVIQPSNNGNNDTQANSSMATNGEQNNNNNVTTAMFDRNRNSVAMNGVPRPGKGSADANANVT